jgi:hypothetical protein
MLKRLFSKVMLSFENSKEGFSGRKLSAFTGVMMAVAVTLFYLAEKDMLSALYAWLLFALICLGIVTIGNLIELKNGKKDE